MNLIFLIGLCHLSYQGFFIFSQKKNYNVKFLKYFEIKTIQI